MSEFELKKIINKYRKISLAILAVFLMLANAANHYMITKADDLRFELGLPVLPQQIGYIWPTIILGFIIVLYLCFYFFEKVLIEVIKNK